MKDVEIKLENLKILPHSEIKGNVIVNNANSIDITLDASDVDGDNLTYSLVSSNNGTVTINGAIATYEPNQDWNGTDTFTYLANDGSEDSNTATVTITVNDSPFAGTEGKKVTSTLIRERLLAEAETNVAPIKARD